MERSTPAPPPYAARKLSPWDKAALFVLSIFVLVWAGERIGASLPGAGWIRLLALLAAAYGVVRAWQWSRHSILWSLRNKLVVAYLLIAVVPLLLVLVMAGLTAYLIYLQLGAYLIYDDLQMRVAKVSAIADAASSMATPAVVSGSGGRPVTSRSSEAIAGLLAAAGATLPGLEIRYGEPDGVLLGHGGDSGDTFAGMVQEEGRLYIRADVLRDTPAGRLVTSVRVPVTETLLDSVAPELSGVQFTITGPARPDDPEDRVFNILGQRLRLEAQIVSRRRQPRPPQNWFDRLMPVDGFSQLDAVSPGAAGGEEARRPVFAFFSARPSYLNARLFSSLGEAGGTPFSILVAIGGIFLILEAAALRTGIRLTRTITRAVDDLYGATQHVQAGDFGHRIRVQSKDQLGVLGESFNTMTASIAALISEQRQRQRLENDLSIAREVQAQLFPQSIPEVAGVELAAVWRAARTVSGDYYDFFRLGPHHLGMVIADISGKGISGALLMASLQAALRSQIVLDDIAQRSTAELVSRLNLHLYRNTSAERYATLFFACYDARARLLRYTNAGHLPPVFVSGNQVTMLETGGMVVGLFDDAVYEEGRLEVAAESILVAYTDGLTEPENVYGTEFGMRRLVEEVLRHRQAGPRRLAESLVAAADEWSSTPEQADDITVLVAGMK